MTLKVVKIYKYIALGIIAVFMACAQQKPLTGGERDFVPPKVLMFMPQSYSVNFTSKSFLIEFDEYVQLNNIYQELIISPPLIKQPEIKIKKKTVIIELQEELKPNTTYTFNFGEGIVDVNEGNKAEDLIYVVSTGNELDSASIIGKSTFPYTNEVAASVKIMLYDDTTDLAKTKIPMPLYFGKANKQGDYAIGFLPNKKFKGLALEDINGNYQVDIDERVSVIHPEMTGSSDSLLSSTDFELYPQIAYTPDISSLDVDSLGKIIIPWKESYNGRFNFEAISANSIPLRSYFNNTRDTLIVSFASVPTEKEEEVYYSMGEAKDTLSVPFYKEAFSSKLKISSGIGPKVRANDSLSFRAPVQITSINGDLVEWKKDSTESGKIKLFTNDSIHFKAILPLKVASNYKLTALPGAFVDVLGNTNDTLKWSFSTYKKEDLGNILFSIDSSLVAQNAVLEIKTKKGERVKTVRDFIAGNLPMNELIPSEYSVMYYIDENKNGYWDGVDFKNQIPAEFVFIFKETINVRANWDVKVKLELSK